MLHRLHYLITLGLSHRKATERLNKEGYRTRSAAGNCTTLTFWGICGQTPIARLKRRVSMSSRKRQYGIEGHIQQSMHVTWGIYCRIPDSGDTWAKEVLGTYGDTATAQSCLRMLLIGAWH